MPSAKRQRRCGALQSLLHEGFISNTGLLKVLQKMRASEENLACATARDINEAYSASYKRFKVSDKFPLKSGGEFVLDYAEPALLLSELIASSDALSNLYKAVSCAKGAEAWRLVVAFDEYTPGNKLQVDNRRKVMNLYISFLDLGQAMLGERVAWIAPLVIRHCVLADIEGGWPRVLHAFLQRLLWGPHGLATAGLPLLLGGEVYVLKAKLACVLSDGEGLKVAFDWKGSSSMKPCLVHYNVFKKDSDLSHRRPGFCEISCADASCFRTWLQVDVSRTMGMLNDAARRLQAGTITKIKFERLSKALGFNSNEYSLWTDPKLSIYSTTDLVRSITYDWMHSCLQDGTLTTEMWVFIQKCSDTLGVTSADLHNFLKDSAWQWPAATRAKSKSLHRVFDSYRSSSSETANKLKASASELLGLYGMLRHFVEVKIDVCDALAAHRASFEAACDVVDVILLCKRRVVDIAEGAAALERAVAKHMTLHRLAYGDIHLKPKHHWMMHIGQQLQRDSCIVDAFVVERCHLLVKSIAEHVRNTSNFEASVMSGVVNQLFNKAKGAKIGCGLRGPVGQWNGFKVSARMSVFCLRIDLGDIVFFSEIAGRVLACAEEGDDLCVIVEELQFVSIVSAHSSDWQACGRNAVWAADQVEQSLAWRTAGGITTVLRR